MDKITVTGAISTDIIGSVRDSFGTNRQHVTVFLSSKDPKYSIIALQRL